VPGAAILAVSFAEHETLDHTNHDFAQKVHWTARKVVLCV